MFHVTGTLVSGTSVPMEENQELFHVLPSYEETVVKVAICEQKSKPTSADHTLNLLAP